MKEGKEQMKTLIVTAILNLTRAFSAPIFSPAQF
jgi:hypothetical protein